MTLGADDAASAPRWLFASAESAEKCARKSLSRAASSRSGPTIVSGVPDTDDPVMPTSVRTGWLGPTFVPPSSRQRRREAGGLTTEPFSFELAVSCRRHSPCQVTPNISAHGAEDEAADVENCRRQTEVGGGKTAAFVQPTRRTGPQVYVARGAGTASHVGGVAPVTAQFGWSHNILNTRNELARKRV